MTSLSNIPNVEEVPLQQPTSHVLPSFLNPEDHGYQVHVAASINLPIIFTCVSLPLYAKIFLIRSRTWDDRP